MESLEKLEAITRKEEIEGVTFTLREFLWIESLDEQVKEKDPKQIHRDILRRAIIEPKLTDEQIDKLPMRIGNKLISIINEMNGFSPRKDRDFLPLKNGSGA